MLTLYVPRIQFLQTHEKQAANVSQIYYTAFILSARYPFSPETESTRLNIGVSYMPKPRYPHYQTLLIGVI